MDTKIIPGAVALLFDPNASASDEDYRNAMNALKGVMDLSSADRGEVQPVDACDWFDDFVSDPSETIKAFEDEGGDGKWLTELATHLPKEADPVATPVTVPEQPAQPASVTPTMQGVSPDQVTVPQSTDASTSTMVAPRRTTTMRAPRTGSAPAHQPSPPSEVQAPSQPVRQPLSTELPEMTKALLQDPTYRRLVVMHLSAALQAKGQIAAYIDSNLQSIGDPLVESHLRLMWSRVRTRMHLTDTKNFEKLFGVTLPTS